MWSFLTTSSHFLFPFLYVHPPKLIVVEGVPWRGRVWSFSWATWNTRTGNNAKSYRRAEIFLDIRKNFNFCKNLGFSATSRFFTEGMSYLLQTLNTHRGYAAKSLQSCSTLCDRIDGSPPGSPVPGILQARTLEWVAISFSNACKWKVKVKSLSRVWLLVTPWTAAHQVPPSMGFSRQEYWSGVPLP